MLTTSVPPAVRSRLESPLTAPLLVAGGFFAGWGAVLVRDPHRPGFWPTCPFAALGYACPGCGGMRGMYDLAHGHLAEAIGHNLLLLPILGLFVLGWSNWVAVSTGRPAPMRFLYDRRFVTVALLVAAVFTVARNLPTPWGHALAP